VPVYFYLRTLDDNDNGQLANLRIEVNMSKSTNCLAIAVKPTLAVSVLLISYLAGCGADAPTSSNDGISPVRAALTTQTGTAVQDGGASTTAGLAEARWRDRMKGGPTGVGCFHAKFPGGWENVPCGPPVKHPPGSVPRKPFQGPPLTVGNSTEYTALSSASLTGVEGSFPTYNNVTYEQDYDKASGEWRPEAYSLQLNTNLFDTARCQQAPGGLSGCKGWVQFAYSSWQYAGMLIESWLVGYGPHCPANWTGYGGTDCYTNTGVVDVGTIDPVDLNSSWGLSASAAANGNDTVILSDGNVEYWAQATPDSTTFLAGAWHEVQFDILGDAGGNEAYFGGGTTIGPEIALWTGPVSAETAAPATCGTGHVVDQSTAGETNNLTLVPGSCCASLGSVSFLETNATGVTAPFCLTNDITSIISPLL
jgi:hypothetical protein